MKFEITSDDALTAQAADERKAMLGTRLSKPVPKKKAEGMVPKDIDAKEPHHFNPNSTMLPKGDNQRSSFSPVRNQANQAGALVVHRGAQSAAVKPTVPTRRVALDDHVMLKDRDFQSQHEEISHLRSNLPDLEKIIGVIKAENVRLRTELLLKGKDCDHFKEQSQQLKIARDREIQTLSLARQEWGKVVSDRDASVDKLQKDLHAARQRLNELTKDVEQSSRTTERTKRELLEEKATNHDEINQLRHKLQQHERESSARISLHHDTLNIHTDERERLKHELHELQTENGSLRLKVVDWDGMVGELNGLRNQIADYKSGHNSSESRLRQELGEAAEEIHLLREEKTGLMRLVEKLELQANAALSKLETVSGRTSPSKSPTVANEAGYVSRPLTSEEEVVGLTASRTRITKELSSFRGGEWSNTLGSIGKLRQHLTEEEVKRREAEDRLEQERTARRRLERDVGDKLRATEKNNEALQLQLSDKDHRIDELHKRQLESSNRYAQLKLDYERDREEFDAAKKELTNASIAIDDLKGKVKSLTHENATLFSQIAAQSEIVSRLQDEVDTFENTKQSLLIEIEKTQKEREAIQLSHDHLLKSNEAINAESRKNRLVSADEKSKIAALERRLLEAEGEVQGLRSKKSKNSDGSPSSDDEAEIEESTEDPSEVPGAHRQLSKKKRLQIELKQAKKDVETFKKVADHLTSQVVESESQLQQKKELENTVVQISREMAKATSTKVKLEKDLEDMMGKTAIATGLHLAEKAKLKEELSLVNTQLYETKASLVAIQKELGSQQKAHETRLKEIEEERKNVVSVLESVAARLGDELTAAKILINNTTHEVQDLKSRTISQETLLIVAEGKLQTTMEERDLLATQLKDSKLSIESNLNKISDLEARQNLVLADLDNNVTLLAESDFPLKDANAQVHLLETQLATLSKTNSDLLAKQNVAEKDAATILAVKDGEVLALAKSTEELRQQLTNVTNQLEELKKDRSNERKKFADQHDFDKKALTARVKQADTKCKELEITLESRAAQLRVESEKSRKLTDLLKQETTALKIKAENDLEQMRDSYERAMTKLRDQIDGAYIIEDLRKKLAKAEKELKDIKQVQLHW